MARPKTDPDAVPTKQRILTAAAEAFATHGYAQTKLAAVARKAGIRRPSLLYHFESKATLYAAVVERAFEELGQALEMPMQTEGAFRDRLRGLVEGFVGFMDAHQAAAGIMVRELVTPDGPGQELLASRGETMLDEVERWVRQTGGPAVRDDVDIRRALLQVVSEALLRNASTAAMANLWGEASAEESWKLTRAMLLNSSENDR